MARLSHERDMLERLSGLEAVPALIDYFTLGGHHFLVEEFVDGNPLQRQLVHRYPLTSATCDEQTIAEYTDWVLDVLPKVRRAVESHTGQPIADDEFARRLQARCFSPRENGTPFGSAHDFNTPSISRRKS